MICPACNCPCSTTFGERDQCADCELADLRAEVARLTEKLERVGGQRDRAWAAIGNGDWPHHEDCPHSLCCGWWDACETDAARDASEGADELPTCEESPAPCCCETHLRYEVQAERHEQSKLAPAPSVPGELSDAALRRQVVPLLNELTAQVRRIGPAQPELCACEACGCVANQRLFQIAEDARRLLAAERGEGK